MQHRLSCCSTELNLFQFSSLLEEFIDLIGMDRAAATLRRLDWGLEGLWDTVTSYLTH